MNHKKGKWDNLAINDKPAVLGSVVFRNLSQSEDLFITTHLLFLLYFPSTEAIEAWGVKTRRWVCLKTKEEPANWLVLKRERELLSGGESDWVEFGDGLGGLGKAFWVACIQDCLN